MNEQLEFLKIIGTRLASANVPYMLTGSLAMAMYAEPRMTRDIDIVIEYGPRDSNRIAQLFEDISYVDSSRIEEAARHEGMFNISVVSPEDLVLSKLDWAKASSSELQMRDVRTIVASVTDLDLEYLRKWAQQLGLTQLLDEATGL